MANKIEKVMWLCCTDDRPVGIVKTYDDIEQRYKYYIGTGCGNSEQQDIERIIVFGQKYENLNFLKDF